MARVQLVTLVQLVRPRVQRRSIEIVRVGLGERRVRVAINFTRGITFDGGDDA